MSDLSDAEKLYLNVGRCLTDWNQIEAVVLQLIEYACSSRGMVGHEIRIGYWAVVSFEARLKMCDAVVSARLQAPKYAALLERWNALNNKLIKKARKRAEIAHGSVIVIQKDNGKKQIARFVPAFFRRIDEHHAASMRDLRRISAFENIPHIKLDEIVARSASFRKLAQDLRVFHVDWLQADVAPTPQPEAS